MDADLFAPADISALLAIRAVIADRAVSASELRALFSATGLQTHHDASIGGVDVLRAFLRPPASR